MTIASPQYTDPFDSDPELLEWLHDCVHDIDKTRGVQRAIHLVRLEWFVRERIAEGVARGLQEVTRVTPPQV